MNLRGPFQQTIYPIKSTGLYFLYPLAINIELTVIANVLLPLSLWELVNLFEFQEFFIPLKELQGP